MSRRHPVRITADELARLTGAKAGRTLHVCFDHVAVWLHHECTWPLPLLAEWRGVMEPLPQLERGFSRAFRMCRCGRVGWYDFVPFSLSAPLLVFPCGHSADEAVVIDEPKFYEAALNLAVPA